MTNHVLRAKHMLRQEITDPEYYEDAESDGIEPAPDAPVPVHLFRISVWQCPGCNLPTVEWEIGYGRDESGYEDSFESENQYYYPERSRENRPTKQFWKLNPKLNRLYKEVIACFNAGSLVLCSLGLRALIEGICDDKGIAQNLNLEKKIKELAKFLPSENIIDALHDVREAGNHAAHRLEPMTRDEAREEIEIVEAILNSLYDLDYKASQTSRALKRAALKAAKPDSDSVQ